MIYSCRSNYLRARGVRSYFDLSHEEQLEHDDLPKKSPIATRKTKTKKFLLFKESVLKKASKLRTEGRLNYLDLLVLRVLLDHANKEREGVWPSNGTIAELCGVRHSRDVRRGKTRLKQAGLIKPTQMKVNTRGGLMDVLSFIGGDEFYGEDAKIKTRKFLKKKGLLHDPRNGTPVVDATDSGLEANGTPVVDAVDNSKSQQSNKRSAAPSRERSSRAWKEDACEIYSLEFFRSLDPKVFKALNIRSLSDESYDFWMKVRSERSKTMSR